MISPRSSFFSNPLASELFEKEVIPIPLKTLARDLGYSLTYCRLAPKLHCQWVFFTFSWFAHTWFWWPLKDSKKVPLQLWYLPLCLKYNFLIIQYHIPVFPHFTHLFNKYLSTVPCVRYCNRHLKYEQNKIASWSLGCLHSRGGKRQQKLIIGWIIPQVVNMKRAWSSPN